jgi:hypothetical protein
MPTSNLAVESSAAHVPSRSVPESPAEQALREQKIRLFIEELKLPLIAKKKPKTQQQQQQQQQQQLQKKKNEQPQHNRGESKDNNNSNAASAAAVEDDEEIYYHYVDVLHQLAYRACQEKLGPIDRLPEEEVCVCVCCVVLFVTVGFLCYLSPFLFSASLASIRHLSLLLPLRLLRLLLQIKSLQAEAFYRIPSLKLPTKTKKEKRAYLARTASILSL